MQPFDRVVLIFNPNSTGNAAGLAAELSDELARRQPDLPVMLQQTEHAGQARDLARDAALTGCPLLVSVSGDGGYNEVVDGAMQSGNDAVVCAVLPAGNANDHRRATREQPLADAIVTGSVTRIDLLRLTVGGSSPTTRYAHSYIGLGLTPVVAVDLEKGDKGSLKEVLTAMRAFAHLRPFEIQLENGSRRWFDSIVFANISQMAKVATVSEDDGRPDDGQFEVISWSSPNFLKTAKVDAGTRWRCCHASTVRMPRSKGFIQALTNPTSEPGVHARPARAVQASAQSLAGWRSPTPLCQRGSRPVGRRPRLGTASRCPPAAPPLPMPAEAGQPV